jgi:L-arabinose isomerase
MKMVIFALDDIFEEWNNITCNEICELYAKFSKMYIMSREESYNESELKVFEVITINIQCLKVKFNKP